MNREQAIRPVADKIGLSEVCSIRKPTMGDKPAETTSPLLKADGGTLAFSQRRRLAAGTLRLLG